MKKEKREGQKETKEVTAQDILALIEQRAREIHQREEALAQLEDIQKANLAFMQQLFRCWDVLGEDCLIQILVQSDGEAKEMHIKNISSAAVKYG